MLKPVGQDLSSSSSQQIVCGLCNESASKYTCPKCQVLYCSLACYKSKKHESCSEQFFKSSIETELKQPSTILEQEIQVQEQKKLIHTLSKYSEESTHSRDGKGNPKQQSRTKPKLNAFSRARSKTTRAPSQWKYVPAKATAEQIRNLEKKFGAKDIHELNEKFRDSAIDEFTSSSEDRPLTTEEEKELQQLVESAPTELLLKALSPEQRRDFENLIKKGNYEFIDDEDEEDNEEDEHEYHWDHNDSS
ncbi:uncharacterized protein RJT20DRAFT_35044 [Scheffersomyces xylosifermentans]|uniref:uncharacterized protein n=1 Tax=Scheffersomyces xylosifermentans TaxID=1304137 RepID=UPI00315D4C67